MKQYKEGDIGTLVPQEERIARGGKGPSYYAVPVGHILCTIEELREMWDECRAETWQDARPTTRYEKPDRLPDFEGYLTSKGITIP